MDTRKNVPPRAIIMPSRRELLEAKQLGYGGITYVAGVLGCSARTIERAWNELDGLPNDPAAGRIRVPGGGRKKKLRRNPNLRQT